ncbi:MAG: hypothetical protein ACRC3B_02865 [Bacteroidia bacterium]
MSDFGALISIRKIDKTSFSGPEIQAMKELCLKVKDSLQLKNSMGSFYDYSVGRTMRVGEDQCFELNVLLSDYWGDAKMFKWHKEVDEKDAKIIAAALSDILGSGYQLKPVFEWW